MKYVADFAVAVVVLGIIVALARPGSQGPQLAAIVSGVIPGSIGAATGASQNYYGNYNVQSGGY